jgi:hypothetical protein
MQRGCSVKTKQAKIGVPGLLLALFAVSVRSYAASSQPVSIVIGHSIEPAASHLSVI